MNEIVSWLPIFFWLLLAVIVYIYTGYFLSVLTLAKIRYKKVNYDETLTPTVAFVISAYNEEDVIRQKLENTFQLDYPPERLTVWVVSDASTDKTDQIVRSFPDNRVHLLRVEGRKGKTFGITSVMEKITDEIVVFSDANALYEPQALRELVKYFADQTVGYVVGRAEYNTEVMNEAGENEGTYWSLELKLKFYESLIASVVGGDGAIYAIRRALFKPLDAEDINDFVNPLHIIQQGYRGVFNPDALCYEDTADTFDKEFSRKRRIVNRSWRGLWKNASVMNPFRTGMFAWLVVSHKLLRWLGGLFFALLFVVNLTLLTKGWLYDVIFLGQIGVYVLALVGALLNRFQKPLNKWLGIPYYFFMVNWYSLLGIADAFRGETYTTWQTIREDT